MKTILLTGSGGFLGRYLKRYLSDAFETYSILTPRSKELDLTNKDAVAQYFLENKIDFIIHSAATGVRITENATMDDVAKPNLEMFKNLAAFASAKCPMIVFGSGAEYGKQNSIVNVRESDFGKLIPIDPYGYSKYLISKEIEKRDYILNLRIFGIYGAGEDPTRVISCMIKDNYNHQSIFLNQNVRFSFIYIDDFCRIIGEFVNEFPNEKFVNLAQPQTIEIKELAEIVNSLSNFKSDIVFKNNGMNKEYTADVSLLKSLLPEFKFLDYGKGVKSVFIKWGENDFL